MTKVDRSAQGIIQSIYIKDTADTSEFGMHVFIDGYIGYSKPDSEKLEDFVKVGEEISAAGLISVDTSGQRMRVRDRSEIGRGVPSIIVGSVTASPGKDVSIKITMRNMNQIAGFKAKLTYDPAKLTFKNMGMSAELGSSANNTSVPGEIVFNAINAEGYKQQTLDIATILFTVSPDVGTEILDIKVDMAEACDINTQNIIVTKYDGAICRKILRAFDACEDLPAFMAGD